MADHLADLLLAPTPAAMANLDREGLAERAELVGDVMVDAHVWAALAAPARTCPRRRGSTRRYVLLTLHRAENVDDPVRLARDPRAASPSGCRSSFRSIPGPARRSIAPALVAPPERRAHRAGRLPRDGRPRGVARVAIATDSGRRPEGGVPVRRPVHHAAQRDGVGRDGRGRLESRRRRRPGWRSPMRSPTRPSCGATARDRRSSATERPLGVSLPHSSDTTTARGPRPTFRGGDPSDPDRSPADGRGGEAARLGGDGLRHRWPRDRASREFEERVRRDGRRAPRRRHQLGHDRTAPRAARLRHRAGRRGDHGAVHVHRQREQHPLHRGAPGPRRRRARTTSRSTSTRSRPAITPRTKAIMPVSLYGQPADLPGLAEIADRRGLALVEDAAQAHGASIDGRRSGQLGARAPSASTRRRT